MLTKNYSDFVEKTAEEFQKLLKNTRVPNKYDYSEIADYIESLGGRFVQSDVNYTEGMYIHLNFYDDKTFNMEENKENRNIFFHQIWYFILNNIQKDKSKVISSHPSVTNVVGLDETAARYFTRAMLLPYKIFTTTVLQNINFEGECNIYEVAKFFDIDYMDVIIRAHNLELLH